MSDTRVTLLVDYWTAQKVNIEDETAAEAADLIASFEAAGLTVTDTTAGQHVEQERHTGHEVNWAGFGGFSD